MVDPRVLQDLREALVGHPEWLDVRQRLERLAPEGKEASYRPFVFAFGYALIPKSGEERRARAGGAFGPKNAVDGWQFPPPLAEVDDADVTAWQAVAEALDEPVALARLHDLLWERRARPRPDLHARAAADAYVEISGLKNWHPMQRTACVTRALELAGLVNDPERVKGATKRAVELIEEVNASGDRAPGVALRILRAVVDLPPARRPAEIDEMLQDTDERFGADPHIHEALGDLRAVLTGSDGQERVRRDQVRRWREAAGEGDAMLRVIRLEHALEIARNHGITEEADEIRRELQDIRPEDLDLQTVSATMEIPAADVDEYIASFTNVDGWRESLRHFGSEPPPGGASESIDEDLDGEREEFVFLSLLTKTVMGHDTAATRLRATDDATRRQLDRAERRAWYARMWSPFAVRALQEIEIRHGRPSHEELAAFFATDLIGPERGERIARALALFWDGQVDEAAHVVVPRLESVLREMARRAGLTIIREPIAAEPGGVRSLGTLLLELQGALPDPPWPEYFFNLLADPRGLNLRNTVAHGLVAHVGAGDTALLLHAACHLRLYGAEPSP
jgi:hypothetical protein